MIIKDHFFQPCGAGAKTTDAACFAVRELGGKRELCHKVADHNWREMCQQPREDHPPA